LPSNVRLATSNSSALRCANIACNRRTAERRPAAVYSALMRRACSLAAFASSSAIRRRTAVSIPIERGTCCLDTRTPSTPLVICYRNPGPAIEDATRLAVIARGDQGTEPSAARRGDDLADIANQTGQHRKVREQRLVRAIHATFDAAAYGVWRDDDQRLSVLDQPTALRGKDQLADAQPAFLLGIIPGPINQP
jgi:hypothetical protein